MGEAMQPTTLTREELFAEVWAEPMHRLAPRYGLSDVGLAKICREMGIPLPWRGYWQKKAAGQKVRPPALPPLAPGSPPHLATATLVPSPPRFRANDAEAAPQVDGHPAAPVERIVVAEKLVRPHPLVEHARSVLQKAKADERGILYAWPKNYLDIRVTRGSLDRALRIMDALVEALEKRGGSVQVRSGKETGTVVRIGEDDIPIRLDERTRRVERKSESRQWLSKRYDFLPTGILALNIDRYARGSYQKTWTDGKTQQLEERLNGFVASLIVAAEEEKALSVERERWHREWEVGQRAREEARRREEEERRRIDEVDKRLEAWEKCVRLCEFSAAIVARANVDGNERERLRLENWLAWVDRYVDRIDPVLHRGWLAAFEEGTELLDDRKSG